MKEITFDTPILGNQEASSKYVSLFTFTGVNHTDKVLTVKTCKANCGCTTCNIPEKIEPNSIFTITLAINKINQSGHFSHGASVTFSNNQVIELKATGTIK